MKIVKSAIVGVGLLLLVFETTAVGLGGKFSLDLSLFPYISLDSSLDLTYGIGEQSLDSFTQFSLGTWVWQEFSGEGAIGPIDWQGHILFGASTADFLYDELIIDGSFANFDLSLYAAQLSEDVLGGPADGAVLQVQTRIGKVELESITEFGADINGIEIFHAATGLSSKYTTDPWTTGCAFTGEKLTLNRFFLCGLSSKAEIYLTNEKGLEYFKFSLENVEILRSPKITTDITTTFELQTKSVTVAPKITVPDSQSCLVPYFSLLTGIHGLEIKGIQISALELESDLGSVHIKDLTVLDRCRWAISTEEYGSKLIEKWKANEEGIQYYTEYWELFSMETRGNTCCGEWHALFNTYFDDEGGSLFGWGMSHLEVTVPFGDMLSAHFLLKISPSGLDNFSLELSFTW
jgi:hypothetical protein